ncbi:hypothetical protein JCM25156A_07090 [Komagataeibacter kakiaceti JCM 25156]
MGRVGPGIPRIKKDAAASVPSGCPAAARRSFPHRRGKSGGTDVRTDPVAQAARSDTIVAIIRAAIMGRKATMVSEDMVFTEWAIMVLMFSIDMFLFPKC